MLHDVDAGRSITAWLQDRCSGGSAPRASARPHLTLHVLQDSGTFLLVEVTHGVPCQAGALLWLDQRGCFEVVVALRREVAGGARSYLRLRATQLPRAA